MVIWDIGKLGDHINILKLSFNEFTFVKGTLIDISIKSDTGLIAENSISKYDLPLSWARNTDNIENSTISEPEYLDHFTNSFIGF